MELTDDIHILVNGTIDKPEELLLLFLFLYCLWRETYSSALSVYPVAQLTTRTYAYNNESSSQKDPPRRFSNKYALPLAHSQVLADI